MALYINGRPVNPIVTFLASAVVIAGIIGLGILPLPVRLWIWYKRKRLAVKSAF